MKALEQADKFHLDAAEGWLGLGDLASAGEELGQLSPAALNHPAVLLARCHFHQAAKAWDPLVSVSQTLVEEFPGLAEAWIHRSYALHELKRTQEAFEMLQPAVAKFPKLPVIQYNLACYACQLGHPDEALRRLKLAVGSGRREILRDALADADLKPLWPQIREL